MRRRQLLAGMTPLALGGCIRLEGADRTARKGAPADDRTTDRSGTAATTPTTDDVTATADATSETDATTQADSTTEDASPTEGESTSDDPGPTLLALTVDWSALENAVVDPTRSRLSLAFGATPAPPRAPTITAIGARLLDETGQLVSTRSVTRTGETDTLQMLADATTDGALQLAAVDTTSDRTQTIALAELDAVAIAANATTTVDATSARWLRADWHVLDDYADTYETGTFTADADAETFDIHYAATYPYSGENIPYRDLLVTLQGIGGPIRNTRNYHTYRIVARNPTTGTTNTTTQTFQPDLASDKFALPPGRYPIGPKGEFTVDWT